MCAVIQEEPSILKGVIDASKGLKKAAPILLDRSAFILKGFVCREFNLLRNSCARASID